MALIDPATNLSRTGLRDWLVQRGSAIILAFYFLFLAIYIIQHPGLSYSVWHGLFAHPAMRIFTFFALLGLVVHSWVGIWTVLTDYINLPYFRLFLTVLMILALLTYLVWGIAILWKI